jgi:flagellar basal body-associated protein FliL
MWLIVLVIIVALAAVGYYYWTAIRPKPQASYLTPAPRHAVLPVAKT